MALKHLRSSAVEKRPQPSGMADGQLAINTASGTPGVFFKDANGSLVKIGPVFIGSGAPNASPASGGTTGNSLGEQWLDTSDGNYVLKIWDGAAWRSETTGLVNSSGGTMTGSMVLGPAANLIFEGSSDDGFETTLTVVDPTADRTITLPNITGTVITDGDTGTVTSAMIANGTILNADINASAAIDGTKISPDFGSQNLATTGTNTAASFSPTSSGTPVNGVYLPAGNSVGIATSSTERFRITNNGTFTYAQQNPATRSSGTLNISELQIGIIRYLGGLGSTALSLPTGTFTEAGFPNAYTNLAFEWSLINTSGSGFNILANAGHSIVGNSRIDGSSSARFVTRRTATNTFVTYRIS